MHGGSTTWCWSDDQLSSPHSDPEKARRVRGMFDAIAPAYERVNRIFSVGRDAYWRRRAVELSAATSVDRVLDVACGTGDLSRAFAAARPRMVVGCDFSHQMLLRGAGGTGANEASDSRSSDTLLHWCEADAQSLPFTASSFDVAACAFGVRNFQDLDAGLSEMRRVLRPGGRVVILEFSRPRMGLLSPLYRLYSERFMPWAATRLSGDRTGAYRYLPRSVALFPEGRSFCARLGAAGFEDCTAVPMTFGVVTLYFGRRR